VKRWNDGFRFSRDKWKVASASLVGGFKSATEPYCGSKNESAESTL